jgi:hypothetical protein
MDEQAVREHAQAHLDALLAGDVDRAIQNLSKELQSHLGDIMALLPLPLTAAEIESIEKTGAGYMATLYLLGESTDTRLETRWKDRDGTPTIVEVSHVAAAEPEAAPPDEDYNSNVSA